MDGRDLLGQLREKAAELPADGPPLVLQAPASAGGRGHRRRGATADRRSTRCTNTVSNCGNVAVGGRESSCGIANDPRHVRLRHATLIEDQFVFGTCPEEAVLTC